MRLLLIEDDHLLSDAVTYALQKHNYAVDQAYDGLSGLDMGQTHIYDVVIVDWMLPGMAGIEIIKRLRDEGGQMPILMLTAREAVENRVQGLDAGADDYMVKPFAMAELLARVRALGRRSSMEIQSQIFHLGDLRFDPANAEVIGPDPARVVKLTFKENQLLELLMKHPEQVLTREIILDRVWGLDAEVEENNIEIYIYYLRKKLQTEDCGFRIETVRGMGYRLTLKEATHV